MSWSTSELRVRLAPLNWFKSSSKIFYWPFQGGTSFVDLLCVFFSLVFAMSFACQFICALWSPAGKGLTSWLSFVVSNCEFVTYSLVSWVRCGTWLYRFLIFAPLLTLGQNHHWVWSQTHRRKIKEESKVASRDWVDHQACSLLQYINVIANLFIFGNYLMNTWHMYPCSVLVQPRKTRPDITEKWIKSNKQRFRYAEQEARMSSR